MEPVTFFFRVEFGNERLKSRTARMWAFPVCYLINFYLLYSESVIVERLPGMLVLRSDARRISTVAHLKGIVCQESASILICIRGLTSPSITSSQSRSRTDHLIVISLLEFFKPTALLSLCVKGLFWRYSRRAESNTTGKLVCLQRSMQEIQENSSARAIWAFHHARSSK